ncbi:MAG: 6-bladed beta-propeller [Parabacteroides sp.]
MGKKIYVWLLLASLFSEVLSQTSSQVPVIDFSKSYPEKQIRLSDLADVEYVPLETKDDVLLRESAQLDVVTDKYLIVREIQSGNVYVFDRHSGKNLYHFNHKGNSGQEYAWISGLVFDEKREEIFICAQAIQVYSISGTYKRTLKVDCVSSPKRVYDYDQESLLVYDEVIVNPLFSKDTKTRPYRFVSKTTGQELALLDWHMPSRYSERVIKDLGNNMRRTFTIRIQKNPYFGKRYVLSDISSDTLYLLSENRLLTPLLTRKPSVHDSEPRKVWNVEMATDKFFYLSLILLDPKNIQDETWMYDRQTGAFYKAVITDPMFRNGWTPFSAPAIAKNKSAELLPVSKLIKASQEKRLDKKGMEMARLLTEDDNQVVRILTFK